MAAAMGELLVYAENFYRRFPEEFLALGAPGLEDIFDLRPHGTRSRRISETPAEKTVEITIRRWQAPSMPPVPPALPLQANYAFPGSSPFQAAYPGHPALVPPAAFSAPAPGFGGYCGAAAAAPGAAAFGAWPRPAWPQDLNAQAAAFGALPPFGAFGACAATGPAPAAAPAAAVGVAPQPGPAPVQQQPQQANGPSLEATYVNTQLSRLESALELIKPQIEAALAGRAKAPAPASSAAASSSGPAAALGATSDHSPSSPLRERRKLTCLSIVKPEAFATQEPAKNVLQAPAVKELTKTASASSEIAAPMEAKLQSSEGCISSGAQGSSLQPTAAAVQQVEGRQGQVDEVRNKGKEHIRPRAVNAVRVASSIMDPESPRSPGKYSAWK